MAITDKKTGVWGLDQVYNKINQGSIWFYPIHFFSWGRNDYGQCGLNNRTQYSSPTQVPGTTWAYATSGSYLTGDQNTAVIKTDGTLWMWGRNHSGELGQNNLTKYSSPVQVGSDTTWNSGSYQKFTSGKSTGAIKTDGTLWMWGNNALAQLGQNNNTNCSSPIQIPGTTWNKINCGQSGSTAGFKTDGTLWMWGHNQWGNLGQNNRANYSSPIQIPGTNWDYVISSRNGQYSTLGLKTDGTLWSWGYQLAGELGLNQGGPSYHSSPTQIPGTTWAKFDTAIRTTAAIKTDGTLWMWGGNHEGELGQNQQNPVSNAGYSSPVQIPGTTWDQVHVGADSGSADAFVHATKTDGTLWAWGANDKGCLGLNQGGSSGNRSSPTQVPGTSWKIYPRGSCAIATREQGINN